MKAYFSHSFAIIILCLIILCIVPSVAAKRVDLIGKSEGGLFLKEGGPDFLYSATPDKWTAETAFDADKTLAYTRYPEKLKMKKSDDNEENIADTFDQDTMKFYTEKADKPVDMELDRYMFSISPDKIHPDNEISLSITDSDSLEELNTQQYTVDLSRVQKRSGISEDNLFVEIFIKILDFLYLKIASVLRMLSGLLGF